MPRNGTRSSTTRRVRAVTSADSSSEAMVAAAAPTPGRITRSTAWSPAASPTSVAARPSRSSA